MDGLGNPLVLGALRCLDFAVETLEGAEDEPGQLDRFKAAHEACRRCLALLEKAIEFGETAPQ